MASRPLHILLASVAVLFAIASGQDDGILRPFAPTCSTSGNYTAGSQYQKNLAELLSRMPAAAGNNGWFYKGSAGAGADEVFGLIMCFADRNAAKCLDCLSRAPAGITTVCPGSRSANAAYDACVLRYDAAPIPVAANLGGGLVVYEDLTGVPITSGAVRDAWVPLMSKLAGGIASSQLRIANDSTPFSGPPPQQMYGLAQCTRDLNGTECVRCINEYTGRLGDVFPNNTGGAIKGYSCNLHYLVIMPIDITLPPSPSPPIAASAPGPSSSTVSTLPPAPPAPAPGPSSPPTTVSTLPPAPAPGPVGPPLLAGPSSSSKTGIVIGASVGSISFLIVLGLSMWVLLRRQQRKEAQLHEETRAMEDEFEKGIGPKKFRYGELAIATDNFSNNHKLGEGGFGSVYRGFLKEMNLEVAIKRVSKGSKQGRKEHASEVRIISRLRHRNLVQLIGWCHDGGALLLVYELMPNRSLDTHLYSARNDALPWTRRHEILLGLGSALLYLHEECEQCVVHRDIKPSNVMLDASFKAKLGDFGLARLVDHAGGSYTTAPAGTLGYMDPEFRVRGRASAQSDIYSFGVVLLEIACGRSPAIVVDEAVIHLAWHVSELHSQGRVLAAVDPRLNGEFNAREMESVLVAGLWCTQDHRSLRPSIRQVLRVLRFELPLPSIPERPPVAIYKPPVGLKYSDPSFQGTNSSIREMSTRSRSLLGVNTTSI